MMQKKSQSAASNVDLTRLRTELGEMTESLATAKSLFRRADDADDLEEKLKVRPRPLIQGLTKD